MLIGSRMSAVRNSSIVRAQPDVVVIGAMRAGTTTLQDILDQIEGVAVPTIKETNFFCGDDSETRSGWDWYGKLFDPAAELRCDISPNYAKRSLYPQVARRIAAANPDAKIVFIARDPVERAVSQYAHSFHSGQSLPLPSELVGTPEGDHIISTSSYAYCLEPFRDHFGDQLEILDFSDLVQTPEDFLHSFMTAAGVRADTSQISMTAQNSSEDLARTPKWWGKLRESQLGDALRRRVPRDYMLRIKGTLAKSWTKQERREVPKFSENDRQRLIEALADDVETFRKTYRKPFSDWCL